MYGKSVTTAIIITNKKSNKYKTRINENAKCLAHQ